MTPTRPRTRARVGSNLATRSESACWCNCSCRGESRSTTWRADSTRERAWHGCSRAYWATWRRPRRRCGRHFCGRSCVPEELTVHTETAIEMRATPEAIYRYAAAVEHWPTL